MANYPYYQPYNNVYGNPCQTMQQSQQIQPVQQPQQTQNGFNCRPVTCREEAVAAQVDFMSAGLIMPDLAHGVIYVKRFNTNTGASDFGEFKYSQPQAETAALDPQKYVTREEFEEFVRALKKTREVAGNEQPV